jgi:glycosyl transferase family 25
MRIVLISMKSQTTRIAFQDQQFDRLGLTYERFEAITPETLPAEYQAIDRRGWERTVTVPEMACLASHREVWKTVAAGSEPVLILEDDAVLADTVPAVLSDLESRSGIEHVTLEVRARKKLISKEPLTEIAGIGFHRLYLDRSGAAAYVLWPAGAQRLLRASAGRAALADAVICACFGLKSLQAVPGIATQADRCAHYGLPEVLKTQSSLVRPKGPKDEKTFGQVLRRLRAQLRQGRRQLRMLTGAVRIQVPVDRDQFPT